jgi:geranylgeranyl diphosphate synthase type II
MAPETIQQYLEARRLRVDQELEKLLPGPEDYPPSIHQAMRHSTFAGGKRLRPILCWESGQLFSGEEKSLLHLGCALELIHTYSLIHDDLPALDNDDLRRGKPTCHRAYGEATAILAGDALLTLAFELLSQPGLLPAPRSLRIIHEISHAIGTRGGMVGGQVVDMEATGRKTDAATLEYIHRAKTGAFICAALRSGALCAHASEEDLARLTTYGEKVGLAFQIADDLLDVTGSKEQLGKSVGKDDQQRKATYPAIHGVEESQQIASRLVREACGALEPYAGRAQRLREIAHFLIERNN